jgi:hypothetical protein
MLRSLIFACAIAVPAVAQAQYAPRAADADSWQPVAPYAREDQVDEGTPDDEAHRADRAYTASLNRRTWPGWNAKTPTRARATTPAYAADLAEHDRAMQAYRQAQARYAAEMEDWQARSDACEQGYVEACGGPRR